MRERERERRRERERERESGSLKKNAKYISPKNGALQWLMRRVLPGLFI
jgi:hypothetical protein